MFFNFKFDILNCNVIYILWTVVSIGIGLLWKKWGLSFSSGIIWSMVLSPAGGLILGLIWKNHQTNKSKMNVFKDDLFKKRYFVTILAILSFIIGIAWFINYNSIESKCKRYSKKLGSSFSVGKGNKLMELQIQKALDPIIQECIKRGGP